jgi:hypothetical protein
MGRLDTLRERVAAAQEEYRTQSLIEPQRPRFRWTDAATLVPTALSGAALVLSAYAVFGGHIRPAAPPSGIGGPVARAAAPAMPALPAIGATGRIERLSTACFALEDYRRIRELRASDPEAARLHAVKACGAFEPGLVVTVDKTSAPDGAVCARELEHGLCFWIPSDALAKP